MQNVSEAYKQEMKQQLRDHTYMRVTLGVINQVAQAAAVIPNPEAYTYFSDLKKPLDNGNVAELYATCEQDYTRLDGNYYFLPRDRAEIAINVGAVSAEVAGAVLVTLPQPEDIKGLTLEFGPTYPVSFRIESDNHIVLVENNDRECFTTQEVFVSATFFKVIPLVMSNGSGRLHIHKIMFGIGVYFDSNSIKRAVKREYINPISAELPSVDFTLAVRNENNEYDIDNESSAINFMESGQRIEVMYGQELPDGKVEWIQGASVALREWSADDETMNFSASDDFDIMDTTYFRGRYSAEGIQLYDLAVDVFEDMGVKEYWIDPYLKSVIVHNPMPPVLHKEALQIIANASRCILYQDRFGNIVIKSSFWPEMEALSEDAAWFSRTEDILNGKEKQEYALASPDYSMTNGAVFFLPEGEERIETGYISEAVAMEDGSFEDNPVVIIRAESSFRCFGMTLEFGGIPPNQMQIQTYLAGELLEKYDISISQKKTVISHVFPEADTIELIFTKGLYGSRVVLNNVSMEERTDYRLDYQHDLIRRPMGRQLTKVALLKVYATSYTEGAEVKELFKGTVEGEHTVYFTNPVYALSCTAADGSSIGINECGSYFATVKVSEKTELTISGIEYALSKSSVEIQLNAHGTTQTWENPIVSDAEHARSLLEWMKTYFNANKEYDITYRGEPAMDANDVIYLESEYSNDLRVRVMEHTVNYDGALSGTINARRDT